MDDPSYEIAYANGESSANADWYFALTELGGLHDDFDCTPSNVAALLHELLAACEQSLKEHTETSPPGTWDNTVDMLKIAIAKAKGESESAPSRS